MTVYKKCCKPFLTVMFCMAASYLHANDLAAKTNDVSSMTSTYSIWKVVASLVFIIAFIPACLWLVKKLQFTQMKFSKSDIRIISSQSLGAKEKLILVEVEGERILIGATSQNINHIKSFSPSSKVFADLLNESPDASPSKSAPAKSSSQLHDQEADHSTSKGEKPL